ncbi:MAG TPA: methyltransferase [Steroidobacteraceae bacterium]|nr:methyltransferase [Steroidobacteraceae bacterium]
MNTSDSRVIEEARRDNHETVKSYEGCAEDYADTTRSEPTGIRAEMFQAFIESLVSGARVLEIGSGPGWDADRLEAKGIRVERTDVTQSFIDFQSKRGKRVTRLDVINDAIEEQYDGILCLYVLQHVARPLIDDVLAKFSRALHLHGTVLIGLREGTGDVREVGTSTGVYHISLWPQREFIDRLARAGLVAEQSHTFSGSDGEWLIVLARKR